MHKERDVSDRKNLPLLSLLAKIEEGGKQSPQNVFYSMEGTL